MTVPGETITVAGDTVTVTIAGEPVTVTVEGEPTTVTVEAEPTTVTVEAEPVTVTVEAEPVTVTVEAEPVTVTVEAEPVTVTVEAAAKTSPTFTLSDWEVDDTVYSAAITYDGDGTLSTNLGTINNNTLIVPDDDGNFFGKVTASEGTNYAAGSFFFRLFTDEVAQKSIVDEPNSLVVWLPFDSSITQDLCGNTWSIVTVSSGSASIGADDALASKAAQFNCNHIKMDTPIQLFGQDFTISFYYLQRSTSIDRDSYLFSIGTSLDSGEIFYCELEKSYSTDFYVNCKWEELTVPVDLHTRRHLAFVYHHEAKMVRVFVDGVLNGIVDLSSKGNIGRQSFYIRLGKGIGSNWAARSVCMVDEFQIFDGVALWTKDFTPPTAEDYAALRAAF